MSNKATAKKCLGCVTCTKNDDDLFSNRRVRRTEKKKWFTHSPFCHQDTVLCYKIFSCWCHKLLRLSLTRGSVYVIRLTSYVTHSLPHRFLWRLIFFDYLFLIYSPSSNVIRTDVRTLLGEIVVFAPVDVGRMNVCSIERIQRNMNKKTVDSQEKPSVFPNL